MTPEQHLELAGQLLAEANETFSDTQYERDQIALLVARSRAHTALAVALREIDRTTPWTQAAQ